MALLSREVDFVAYGGESFGVDGFDHAREAEGLVEVGFRIEAVAGGDVVEGVESGFEEGFVYRCRAARFGSAIE